MTTNQNTKNQRRTIWFDGQRYEVTGRDGDRLTLRHLGDGIPNWCYADQAY